jgi:hypothetical protein
VFLERRRFKKHLAKTDKEKLNVYFVSEADRKFQLWERESKLKEYWWNPF